MALAPAITDIEQLKSHPALGRLVEWNPSVVQAVKFDRDELTIWIEKDAIREVCAILRDSPGCPFNYFCDVTCVVLHRSEPRFEVVYHLLSIAKKERVRLKVRLDGSSPALESVTSVWPAANFYEREVFDLFGVRFSGHPNLIRIMMPDDWEGHPLRKDYPVEGYREVMAQFPTAVAEPGQDSTLVLNMGPHHPSTHGVLRLILEIDGETIVRIMPDIGYLHTGIEKTCEAKFYQQVVPLTDRIDYLCPLTNNLTYCLAVEKLLGLEIPPKAQWMRVLMNELTRINSHLVWLGTHAMDIGALTVFLYCFREREEILKLFEAGSGQLMMTSYFRVGGIALEPPLGFFDRVREFAGYFPSKVDEYENLLTGNPIWGMRTKGVARMTAEDAIALGASGPTLRGSGVDFDLRRDMPYSSYEKFEFKVPVSQEGDGFARYMCRVQEWRESAAIVRQALDGMPEGPIKANAPGVVLPDREKMKTEMEALIYHFKIITAGFGVA